MLLPTQESQHMALSQSESGVNFVLASLPDAERARLMPLLKPRLTHLGESLWEMGQLIEYVFFPKQGVISLVLTSAEGVDVEVGMVGREGLVGGIEVLGTGLATMRAQVQGDGSGWRMESGVLRAEFARGGAFQGAVLRAHASLAFQSAQCALCNRLHTVDQRLSRWLLMASDRTGTPSLNITHEFIATMLGTRRAGVTVAAGALRELGLISYSRGVITILDRAGMEKTACECYHAIERNFNRFP